MKRGPTYKEVHRYKDAGGTWLVERLEGNDATALHPKLTRRRLSSSHREEMTEKELQNLISPPPPAWDGYEPAGVYEQPFIVPKKPVLPRGPW